MRTFFRFVIVLPVAVLIVLFAVANRHRVAVSLDPFPGDGVGGLQMTAPLFVLLFAAGALGVLAGGIAVWFRQGRFRRAARDARAEAREARGQANDLRDRVAAMEGAAFAALPPAKGRNAA